MTLTDKVKEKQFIVIDQILLDQPKTKEFVKILSGLKTGIKTLGKKNMFIMPKNDPKLMRSSRNIPSLSPVLANSLNLVDILKADSIIVVKDSLAVIEKTYLKTK